jgi:hypothetical protein
MSNIGNILEALSEAKENKQYDWEENRLSDFSDTVKGADKSTLDDIYNHFKGDIKRYASADSGKSLRETLEDKIRKLKSWEYVHSPDASWNINKVNNYELANYIVGRFVKEHGDSYKSKSGVDKYISKHFGTGDVVFDGTSYYVY